MVTEPIDDGGVPRGESDLEQEGPPDRKSRRAVIAGGLLAGVAGVAGATLLRAEPAGAATGDPVIIGEINLADNETVIQPTPGKDVNLLQVTDGGPLSEFQGTGTPLQVYVLNPANPALSTLDVRNAASGTAIQASDNGNGTGSAIQATVSNPANGSPAIFGISQGSGSAVTAFDGAVGTGPGLFAQLENPANPSNAVRAEARGPGSAVFATDGAVGTGSAVEAQLDNTSNAAAAVSATTSGTGGAVAAFINNAGSSAAAVSGETDGTGTGVLGTAFAPAATGVAGTGNNGATGISGTSDTGTGVAATSSDGTALAVDGVVTFSRSGLATVPSGAKSVTVTLGQVTPSSLVLATLQEAQANVSVQAAVPGTDSFTILMNGPVSHDRKVAWFVIN